MPTPTMYTRETQVTSVHKCKTKMQENVKLIILLLFGERKHIFMFRLDFEVMAAAWCRRDTTLHSVLSVDMRSEETRATVM